MNNETVCMIVNGLTCELDTLGAENKRLSSEVRSLRKTNQDLMFQISVLRADINQSTISLADTREKTE